MAKMANDVVIDHFGNKGTITVNVVISKQFRARIWLAIRLLKLASWILKTNIEINQEDHPE